MTCTIVSDGSELLHKYQNEHEKPYPEIKERLREIIWTLYCNGYDTFCTNGEYGVPLWASEIICSMKMYNSMTLNIVMPYEEQALGWLDEIRERYFKVHAKADKVILKNHVYRDGCYDEADRIMIDDSDLLAVFGAKDSKSYAAEYAKKIGALIKYF